ncbi:MAG TPA: TIGR01777 family oxidoreductase [Kineosporiaceae bacterium]|nr:TIGR01777 family oxidoreductase [Kineosporiaceae bacterium]
MKIAVTGASGFIGSALVPRLRAGGHDVVRLVRRPAQAADEVSWDPDGGSVDVDRLAGLDAAVHLAGAGVGDHRWTDEYKRTIRDSRVLGTRTLVKALTALDPLPRVLVSGAAVGVYGDRGDEELTEQSSGGSGFLADVVRAWEAESEPAAAAGIRVANIRTGLVMAPQGGAFGRLLPLIKLGLAGPLGSGKQWWPWITMEDQLAAIEFLLATDVSGPVNLSAPHPARQKDVVKALARAAHRPALLPAPKAALRIALGEFSDDLLASQRVLPRRLLAAGFTFRHPELDGASEWVLRSR